MVRAVAVAVVGYGGGPDRGCSGGGAGTGPLKGDDLSEQTESIAAHACSQLL